MSNSQGPNSVSLQKMVIEQIESFGKMKIIPGSPTKGEQVNKELADENGQKDASWKPEPAEKSESQGQDNDYSYGLGQ